MYQQSTGIPGTRGTWSIGNVSPPLERSEKGVPTYFDVYHLSPGPSKRWGRHRVCPKATVTPERVRPVVSGHVCRTTTNNDVQKSSRVVRGPTRELGLPCVLYRCKTGVEVQEHPLHEVYHHKPTTRTDWTPPPTSSVPVGTRALQRRGGVV